MGGANDELIKISWLNDFTFCPVSIYFHNLYDLMEKTLYQSQSQIAGTAAHTTVDNSTYTTRKTVMQGVSVFCEKYGLVGKIDIFDEAKGLLTERKKKISQVYDGYIFQLYAQYFALTEMGYKVKELRLHSMDDNKNYSIPLPDDNVDMLNRFEKLITELRTFEMNAFVQENPLKCKNCIYRPSCDRSSYVE